MRAGIRSNVTEAEHVQVPAATCHGRQTRDVVPPLIGVEGVKQPAIEHRLKRSAQTVQVQGIGNHEVGVYAASRGLLLRIDTAVSATSTPRTGSPSEAT
jgi:hypothetical protein